MTPTPTAMTWPLPRRDMRLTSTNIVSRHDLNYLFAEMLGGIEVGHLGVGGGDIPSVNRVPAGLLGADLQD